MTSTSNKNEKIIDELTISEDFNLGLSGEQVFPEAAISNKKPSETEWFRIYGSTRKDIEKVYCVKVMVDGKEEQFILGGNQEFKQRVANDFKNVQICWAAYYITSQGRMGIWAPSVKEFLSISNKWTDTAEQILDIAQHDWVNVKSNMKNRYYECYKARPQDQEQYGEPNFKLPYKEVIKKAWGSDFTLNPDNYENNEYVMQSIGIPVSIKVSD